MNFTCIEIRGAIYQPENIFPLGNFQIIPATEKKRSLEVKECKVIFISEKQINEIELEAQLFIFCYQFLFLRTDVYYFFSLAEHSNVFYEDGKDITTVAKKIESNGFYKINFEEIDIFYTNLPIKINFRKFHNQFSEKYNRDNKFKNIMDLYLYTVGSKSKLYNNIFQKISQLQTIFETILGKPEEEFLACGQKHSKETWDQFITKKLIEKGITDKNEIDLIIKIKKILNWSARVKYTHYSQQLNTWQKTIEEIKTSNPYNGKSEYTTDLKKILDNTLKIEDWTGLDWENVYFLYQTIIKQLLFLEYFKA